MKGSCRLESIGLQEVYKSLREEWVYVRHIHVNSKPQIRLGHALSLLSVLTAYVPLSHTIWVHSFPEAYAPKTSY